MSAKIHRDAVEHILMGPEIGRRFTQDSPVLPDVWFAYAGALDKAHDLLITPFKDRPVAEVAAQLRRAVYAYRDAGDLHGDRAGPEIAALPGTLSAPDDAAPPAGALIHRVSRNRDATPAVDESVRAIKADAAQQLFNIDCSQISWAILDSGIDALHPAFRLGDGPDDGSRVLDVLDFSVVRRVLSVDEISWRNERQELVDSFHAAMGDLSPGKPGVRRLFEALVANKEAERPTDWGLVAPLIRRPKSTPPMSNHGTHVAGILAARESDEEPSLRGVCPDIRLYDCRVIGPDLFETEFAIMAALQYLRHLNQTNDYMVVHGANLSLSIPHDVENYACGRTPICDECEHLVASGVVVVAAAGNRGYNRFETDDGLYEGYTAFSITDPGNADAVITVGATHRYWPHTYGVSYFSSRGPTGDGRLKPDLVAPGEKITAPLPQQDYGPMDGTSMAAPHVSGAAAMLMARYSELVGNPERIKQILCDSATDLGRERSFQGNGMLDVLRALQSI